MDKKLEEKQGNLQAQKKQVKIEIQEYEEALRQRTVLLHKLDGALELLSSLTEKKEDKKEK